MGDLTLSQRQQRLTNVLLTGNLYKSHQISKKLTEVTKLQQISIGVSVANLAVNKQISSGIDNLNSKIEHQITQKEREEAEKKKIKLLKDIFFNISEEIDEIEESKSYPLEKYFLLFSLKAELDNNKIDTSLTDDINEKKLISSTIKSLNKKIEELDKNFKNDEREDQEQILEILEEDEEASISNLEKNKSEIAWRKEFLAKVEEYYVKKYKENKYCFVSSKWKLSKDIFEDVKENGKIDKFSHDTKLIPDVTEKDDNSFFLYAKTLDNQIFWEEFHNNFYKDMTRDQFKEYEKIVNEYLTGYNVGKIPTLEMIKSSYMKKLGYKNHFKNSFGKLDIKIVKEYFYDKHKKSVDEIHKIIIKSIKDCFKDELKLVDQDNKKINQLNKTIEKEKDLVKKLQKRHPFVKKILASRI